MIMPSLAAALPFIDDATLLSADATLHAAMSPTTDGDVLLAIALALHSAKNPPPDARFLWRVLALNPNLPKSSLVTVMGHAPADLMRNAAWPLWKLDDPGLAPDPATERKMTNKELFLHRYREAVAIVERAVAGHAPTDAATHDRLVQAFQIAVHMGHGGAMMHIAQVFHERCTSRTRRESFLLTVRELLPEWPKEALPLLYFLCRQGDREAPPAIDGATEAIQWQIRSLTCEGPPPTKNELWFAGICLPMGHPWPNDDHEQLALFLAEGPVWGRMMGVIPDILCDGIRRNDAFAIALAMATFRKNDSLPPWQRMPAKTMRQLWDAIMPFYPSWNLNRDQAIAPRLIAQQEAWEQVHEWLSTWNDEPPPQVIHVLDPDVFIQWVKLTEYSTGTSGQRLTSHEIAAKAAVWLRALAAENHHTWSERYDGLLAGLVAERCRSTPDFARQLLRHDPTMAGAMVGLLKAG